MGQAFGGVVIDFSGRTETLEDIFGTKDLSPAEMTAKLWAFVKAHGLRRRQDG
jgi:chromatin remodeling complex protein RSC6